MAPDKDSIVLSPANAEEFHAWLDAHGERHSAIWVRYLKKGVSGPSITYDESVDVALCHGWIDGQKNTLDAESYVIRFTPRKATGPWSQVNVRKAERLMAEGQMRPQGHAQVEAARADGRWDRAYASQSEFEVPEDFLAALKESPEATATFETLNRVNLYAIYYRLQTTSKPETRAKKVNEFVAKLARGEKFH